MELVGEAQEVVALSREECSGRCVSPGAAQPGALVRAKRQPCSFPHNQTQGRTLCKSSPDSPNGTPTDAGVLRKVNDQHGE